MSRIIIDNQTDLPDSEALVVMVGCLSELDNGYEVTIEDKVITLKVEKKQ